MMRVFEVVLVVFFGLGGVRRLTRAWGENPRACRYQALLAGLWVTAIVSLSQCFATYYRLCGAHPNPHPALNVLSGVLFAGILMVSFLALGFFMYREDSRSGKLRRKLALYERFLAPRDADAV
jgi:hypothetical protein